MTKLLVAWALMFLFATIYTMVVYKVLRERNRTDLMWIPAVSFVVPVVLFLITQSPFSIVVMPVMQSAGMALIQRLVSKD